MLRYFYDNNLVAISEKTPKDWEEAIRESGEILKQNGLITDQYVDQVVNDVKEYGPYIVIVPGVAMPHSSAKNEGVLGTGIGFTLLAETVSFEEGNPEKDAQLFFMLAAKDSAAHMENIANLSDLLMTEGLIDDLKKVKTMEDYVTVMEKYQL